MPEPGRFNHGRHAGVLIPLFSIPSRQSWGIGEIPDLVRFARWLDQAGLDLVQLLPVNEMEAGQNSPYSAMTAMGIDPVFIAPNDVGEFAELGGEASLSAADRHGLEGVRGGSAVDFAAVRALKGATLRACFDRFKSGHLEAGTDRGAAFREFVKRAGWWLDDYSLFRALHEENGGRYWREWDAPLRDRQADAVAAARERLADSILYYQYLQWLADGQWQQARRECGRVGLFGDFPFMVGGHSADVWARQHEFNVDGSIGVAPDPGSEAGQDWGLPAPRWEVMEPGNFEWVRQRVQRSVELFDGFRIDHLVGFYRTFVRERDGHAYFTPADEHAQLAHGERMMRLFADGGVRLLAEDLGSVPDFVRESLARLRLPGMKVLRWERHWKQEGQPFRLPSEYPADSVAISGTHDTESMAEWWDAADRNERELCSRLPGLAERGCGPDAPFSPAVRDALLRAVFESGSDLVIVPVQDAFGWRDRVNLPGVVTEENWTWRLPWLADELATQPEAQERATFLAELSRSTGRG